MFTFEGLKRVGVAFTAPLIATAPFFSIILALLLLKEHLTILIALGTAAIMLGVFLLSWYRPKQHIHLRYLLLPIIAAAMIGSATVLSKIGLTISNFPYSGIAIATTAGAVTQTMIVLALRKWKLLARTAKELKFFLIAGLTVGIGLTLLYMALSRGNVVIVMPINHTQVMFSLFFSWLLLHTNDYHSRRTVLGAVAIILGASLVSVGA
jgi:uncharacterized membrane protein